MESIAIVDDDLDIRTALRVALEAEGYRVTTYADAGSALQAITSGEPDVAIIGLKTPPMGGMELLRSLRRISDVPVIVLTARLDENEEIRGFQFGADDYLRKPFSGRLLVERIKALLRRRMWVRSRPAAGEDASDIEPGGLYLDHDRHACVWKGRPITLTTTEFLILQELASRPGVVKSRDALASVAYRTDDPVDGRSVDSHIKRLRRKFKAVDDRCEVIQTLFGVGYRLQDTAAPPVSASLLHECS